MQTHTFIADCAADAVAQIRQQLGPEAIVVNVRKKPAPGLGRLLGQSRIEVEACVPEKPEPPPDPLADIKLQLAQIKQQIECRETSRPEPQPALESFLAPSPPAPQPPNLTALPPRTAPVPAGHLGLLLENTGMLPLYATRLLTQLRQQQRSLGPQTVAQEIESVCAMLKQSWRAPAAPLSNVHVFIGPPGVGKTTCLCKWLARTVLMENRPASVWRLDGTVANAAESLSLYAEILGVPVERFLPPQIHLAPEQLLFIDLPGVSYKDAAGLNVLAGHLKELPPANIHLVLNIAYETRLLLAQARAFASFPVNDLILTHLDEETLGGKLWNLVLGTNYSISILSAGQKIPGGLETASPEVFFKRQFPHR